MPRSWPLPATPSITGGLGAFLSVFLRLLQGALKAASLLEQRRLECLDSLSRVHKVLYSLAKGVSCSLPLTDPKHAPEACIPCRLAFASRQSWASHAARLHGYRRSGTLLAQGLTCFGCGTTYATSGRLRRHVNYSGGCRRAWGRFQPSDGPVAPHPQLPAGPRPSM